MCGCWRAQRDRLLWCNIINTEPLLPALHLFTPEGMPAALCSTHPVEDGSPWQTTCDVVKELNCQVCRLHCSTFPCAWDRSWRPLHCTIHTRVTTKTDWQVSMQSGPTYLSTVVQIFFHDFLLLEQTMLDILRTPFIHSPRNPLCLFRVLIDPTPECYRSHPQSAIDPTLL